MAVKLEPQVLESVVVAVMEAKNVDEKLVPLQKKLESVREESLGPEIIAFQKEYDGSSYDKGGALEAWEHMKCVIDEHLAKVNPAPEAFQANSTVTEAVTNRTELHSPKIKI